MLATVKPWHPWSLKQKSLEVLIRADKYTGKSNASQKSFVFFSEANQPGISSMGWLMYFSKAVKQRKQLANTVML